MRSSVPGLKFSTLRLAQVHADAALVARLQIPPKRGAIVHLAPCPQRVAAVRWLNLDDVGAELRQQSRRERRGDEGSQFNDAQFGEGSAHMSLGVALNNDALTIDAHSREKLPKICLTCSQDGRYE